jgi:hypothetical protein
MAHSVITLVSGRTVTVDEKVRVEVWDVTGRADARRLCRHALKQRRWRVLVSLSPLRANNEYRRSPEPEVRAPSQGHGAIGLLSLSVRLLDAPLFLAARRA